MRSAVNPSEISSDSCGERLRIKFCNSVRTSPPIASSRPSPSITADTSADDDLISEFWQGFGKSGGVSLRRNHRPDAATDRAEYGARYKYVSTGSAGTGTDDAGGLGWGHAGVCGQTLETA